MKNDIDEILNDLFAKSSVSGKSQAAMEAEAFLASLSKNGKKTDDKFQKQLDEIDKLSQSTKEQLNQMETRLKNDGIAVEIPPQTKNKEKDIDKLFKIALDESLKDIIGQDEFLRKLSLSFKRPFVMGKEKDKALSVTVVNGKTGTGRHSAIKSIVKNLKTQNILDTDDINMIDLSLYSSPDESKIFIQDMFSAVYAKSSVIVFENFDKCHRSCLNKVLEMATDGKIQLGSRYANQKGIFIDVGTALVKEAISSISCTGKYLLFITDETKGKLADKLGSKFIDCVTDMCTTKEFSAENINLISKKTTDELSQKSLNKLNFTLNYNEEVISFFADKYTLLHGINSIEDYAQKCFKLLSEFKLNEGLKQANFNVSIQENILQFSNGTHTIKVQEVKEDNDALTAVKGQIDEIIGLDEIKEYIFALQDNYKMKKLRGEMGLKVQSLSMHMIFTGNPGTGKTSIARLISRYLKAIGVLTGGQLIEVTRADLVGKYVGHTAPLTKQIIESAVGGVLFIDEAYSLCRGDEDNFGLEAIDTLVKCMEDNRENLIVILAGYTKEMEQFLKTNSGLVSRFPNIIEFPDYSADELFAITELMAKNKGYKLDEEMHEKLISYYDEKQNEQSSVAGNGRMARNMLESAILNQSKRIMATGKGDFEKLILEDFEF